MENQTEYIPNTLVKNIETQTKNPIEKQFKIKTQSFDLSNKNNDFNFDNNSDDDNEWNDSGSYNKNELLPADNLDINN